MELIAHNSWPTAPPPIFFVPKHSRDLPVVVESSGRLDSLPKPLLSSADFTIQQGRANVSLTQAEFGSQKDGLISNASEHVFEGNVLSIENIKVNEAGFSVVKSEGKKRRSDPQLIKKVLPLTRASRRIMKKQKLLSVFEELMLKLDAIDGPQLVLKLTRLEDMPSTEIATSLHAR